MSYDERLANRIRKVLDGRSDVSERRMFGGLAFMVGEHMTVGIVEADLMVRVGPDAWEDALAQPHARPMDFTGKPMKGFVYVSPSGLSTAPKLRQWIARGLSFTQSLPKKPKKPKKKAAKSNRAGKKAAQSRKR